MVRYFFYTIGDLTYQSPLVQEMNTKINWMILSFVKISIHNFHIYCPI